MNTAYNSTGFSANNKLLLVVCLSIYVFLYYLFLRSADFLPYVIDNNETYSSLVHAFNMYYGDWSKTFGLADEAFSLDPDAHPYVHTRQGNWPRIYTFILYALGARTPESQIIIHVFTIGLLGIYFMYKFFNKISSSSIAALVTIIFMTDYMFVMQWQIVTYRVWHVFFVFSSLLCMHGLAEEKGKKYLYLTFINFMCLCYWELIFAFFLTLWSFIYYCIIKKPKISQAIKIWCLIAAGCISSIVTLVIQLILYMGAKNAFLDFYYAFMFRNHITAMSESMRHTLKDFYTSNNIAFFFNMVDGTSLRNIQKIFDTFFIYGMQIYTPPFAILVIILMLSLFLKFCVNMKPTGKISNIYKKISCLKIQKKNALWITSCSMFLAIALLAYSNSFLGLYNGDEFIKNHSLHLAFIIFLLPIPITFLIIKIACPISSYIHTTRFLKVNVFLLVCAYLLYAHGGWYEQYTSILWYENIVAKIPMWIWIYIFISLYITCSTILLSDVKQDVKYRARGVGKYLFSGLIAFIVTYLLSPGYIYSGYVVRYSPIIVFLLNPIVAISVAYIIACSYELLKLLSMEKQLFFGMSKTKGIFLSMLSLFIISGAALFSGYWFFVQIQYFRLLPPDSYVFIKQFRNAKYQNASVITNGYPLPISFEMNGWAYMNQDFTIDILLNKDLHKANYIHNDDYLWYKDRIDKKYLYPDYYVCTMPKGYYHIVQDLQRGKDSSQWCSLALGLSTGRELDMNDRGAMLQARLEGVDFSEKDAWGIVKLDWDLAQYR